MISSCGNTHYVAVRTFRNLLDIVIIAAPGCQCTIIQKSKHSLICHSKILYSSLNFVWYRVKRCLSLCKRDQSSIFCQCKSGRDVCSYQLDFLIFCLGRHDIYRIFIPPGHKASILQYDDGHLISCRDGFHFLTLDFGRNPVQVHPVVTPCKEFPFFVHGQYMVLSDRNIYYFSHVSRNLFQSVCKSSPLVHNPIVVNPNAECRTRFNLLCVMFQFLRNTQERKSRCDILLRRILEVQVLLHPDWQNKAHQKDYNEDNGGSHGNFIFTKMLDNCPERTLHLFFFKNGLWFCVFFAFS